MNMHSQIKVDDCGCGDQPQKDKGRHCHCGHEHVPSYAMNPEQVEASSPTKAVYRIDNMDCPMEEQLIRKRLASVPGIKNLHFNLLQRVLTVEHEPGNTGEIESALRSIDMIPEPVGAGRPVLTQPEKIPYKKLGLSLLLAACSEAVEFCDGFGFAGSAQLGNFSLFEVLSLVFALASILAGGLETFKKGWLAISNFNLNMNALMAVAVTGAFLIGQFPEAAMVMALFNISESIEARALDRARNAVRELMALAPDTATMQMPDGSWVEREIADVPVNSLVRVRPGQKIALDGIVREGSSTVNQASITGESMPVEKKAGDPVFAGTLNEAGSFIFKTTAIAGNTTLARIIHAVEEAQSTRAPVQRFVDTFAKYYTPAIFCFAILWACLPPLLFNAAWTDSIYTALVILVIGCPCALVISTPVTVVSGMTAAASKGILIKGGLYLEQGRRLTVLALDKTGTVTMGEPVLIDAQSVSDMSMPDALKLAASLASRSDHPVSKAIANAATRDGVKLLPVEAFKALPGRGVCGEINGKNWYLGAFDDKTCATPELDEKIGKLEKSGGTLTFLASDGRPVAIFAVADKVRQTSAEAIRELAALNVSAIMLTGDNARAADAIASEAGISKVRAELLPEQKLAVIEDLKKQGNIVGMVGDGINDAPALAMANIGFAMAFGGTDTAIETADVALMDDDLRKVPRFIRLSRATYAILVENIVLALGIKTVFFVLALTGMATMWMAVFADVGAALLVVANGLRARRK